MRIKTAISTILTKAAAARMPLPFTPPPVISRNNTALLDLPSPLPLKFIFIALVLLATLPAHAATFNNIDTHAKLVTAINTANGNSEADTINITANITLTADLPNIASAMTIQGSGARRTLDGANSHRAFTIRVGGYSVTINDLALTKMQPPSGGDGAAIDTSPNSGGRVTLELNRVTISNSSAWYSGEEGHSGALTAGWTNLTINDSIFDGNRGINAGAIQIGGNVTATINRSVFRNNVARSYAGALRVFAGTATVNNSTFYNNSSENSHATALGHGGAIEVDDGGTLNLNHVTITGNTVKNATSNRGGGLANILLTSTTTVRVRNSIIFGNTPEDCYQTIALSVNIGNIIGSGNCGAGTNGSSQNPNLQGPSNGYYIPRAGGSAIDAVACLTSTVTNKWNEDQRGQTRPNPAGGQCDIGAIEDPGWSPPPPPPPAPPGADVSDDGDGGGGSGSRSSSSADAALPGAIPVFRYSPEQTCQTLQPAIVVSKASSGTSCQRVYGSGVGHPDVIAANPSLVVDLWGWVSPGTQVCFRASSGSIKFIDTAALPRTVADLPVFSEAGGLLCAIVNGAGQVALVAGPPAPSVPTALPPTYQSLSGCMVLLQYSLNFRDAPDGDKIGALPSQVRLTALERTAGWFHVDYHGAKGWISAMYVKPEGNCG